MGCGLRACPLSQKFDRFLWLVVALDLYVQRFCIFICLDSHQQGALFLLL